MKIKCTCKTGTGHRVLITYPASPKSEQIQCCSCTVERFRVLYGEPSFVVTAVTSTSAKAST